ncbi:MAG: DNA phosphorothioation system sulfurtransferase DndC [Desulfobacteraceae bacterium]|nr:DNA phosphorothioation system sulfurtransferase DndC [Desulfobacteraceae bacterium]
MFISGNLKGSTKLLKPTRDYLLQQYFADQRPWVVAFSGGKDSTLLLQLVYEMLLELKEKAHKPVFAIVSDTRVEPPNIIEYLNQLLNLVQSSAEKHDIPLTVKLVNPLPEESFWGKLIGRGYPPPTRWFRWCTSYMKIKPSRRAIDQIIHKYGSVILLLGTRLSESSGRKQRMESRQYSSRGLNPHHEIPNALVSVPIADWTNDDVWNHLLQHNHPPWGGSHEFMMNLYTQATGGECPFILDLITPSCGNSRFGCWTCTVVKNDISMQGFITSGEEWMRPLYNFRNWLKEIREDPSMRSSKRRNGIKKPGTLGPFTAQARMKILEELLEIQNQINKELISDEEIYFIQQEWNKEFDLGETAINLANSFGRKVKTMNKIILPSQEQRILDSILAEYESEDGVSYDELVRHLLYLVKEKYHGTQAALDREVEQAIEKSTNQVNNNGV